MLIASPCCYAKVVHEMAACSRTKKKTSRKTMTNPHSRLCVHRLFVNMQNSFLLGKKDNKGTSRRLIALLANCHLASVLFLCFVIKPHRTATPPEESRFLTFSFRRKYEYKKYLLRLPLFEASFAPE